MRRLFPLSCALALLPAIAHAGNCDPGPLVICTGSFQPPAGQIPINYDFTVNRGSNGDGGIFGYPATSGGTGDTGRQLDFRITRANIDTDNAVAIRLRTVGGNGGSGGSGFGGTEPGNGGTGGVGGQILLNIEDNFIYTSGKDAVAAAAISLGGTGGKGGTGTITSTAGNGGQGGDGKMASISLGEHAEIHTTGAGAFGLFAQSGGGLGGDGGDAKVISHGGKGAGGANGGFAVGASDGKIETLGNGATAVLVQSLGGFGGDGGSGTGFFTFGGDARTGGNGGQAKAMNTTSGSIKTSGDDALGLVAQSIGGGGGLGGASIGIGNLGGDGDAGGNGGIVFMSNSGSITTTGQRATGMLAQSIGGGGGSGGGAYGYISIGGKGKGGGDGGVVDVVQDGTVSTSGDNATAVKAQSIGGGGGNGGSALSAGPLASVAIGGDAGQGGNGGAVEFRQLYNTPGVIQTTGNGSAGIYLQSAGGGGGSGNWVASLAAGSVAGSVAVGGTGGQGGSGGTIDATFSSRSIFTDGNNATALFAQSLGGGGGDAGVTFSAAAATNGAVAVALGGKGGAAGDGGAVNINWLTVGVGSESGIVTRGASSPGILAQSAGGGGGNAGVTISGAGAGVGSASLAIGGAGGGGGNGGAVNLLAQGRVTTHGDNSAAVLGESVGGGGGNGGLAINAALSGGGALNLGLGGVGGPASRAGTASVSMTGTVLTYGVNSTGVEALSVGKSGGTGGISGTLTGAPTITLGASLGGGGGKGGDAAAATTTYSGQLITQGAWSNGVVARSVGGGGGDGGIAVDVAAGGVLSGVASVGGGGTSGGNGGTASVTVVGAAISTKGANANGIEASSIGGGGGSGGIAISGLFTTGPAGLTAAIGGLGAQGGGSGAVTVDSTAYIDTLGTRSVGILGQSVAGGGGSGGISGAISGAGGGSLVLAMGGNAGAGGTAGSVTVSASGSVSTAGDNAQALLAQSLAGGGGRGGISVSASGAATIGGGSVALGGSGGGGGTAGAVSVTGKAGANFRTQGSFSDGVLAQSLGGGGGAGGLTVAGALSFGSAGMAVGIGGGGGTAGQGGTVTVNLTGGSVFTAGTSSAGVKAESVGGGGGDGGMAIAATAGTAKTQATLAVGGSGGDGATAGDVTLTAVAETIGTSGDMSAGVVAQSVARGGGNGALAVSGSLLLPETKSLAVSVGGSGGRGSTSGDVSLLFGVGTAPGSSSVTTTGAKSYGLLAQSIGGGGGVGGMAVSGQISMAVQNGKPSATADVAVGGTGGSGNNAGKVKLQMGDAVISTAGADAFGVLAESIGGGGGEGGAAMTGSLNFASGVSDSGSGMGVNVAVGGKGGMVGGDGDAVAVDIAATGQAGSILTTGDRAKGIVARSVGGGGGYGGAALTALATDNAVKSVGLAVGGVGGTGGNGGKVDLTNRDTVATAAATGIFAESVGGGGGDGGSALSVAITNGKSMQANATVGGNGGTGGNGGDVTLTNSGKVTVGAGGDGAYGILATSVGGGGGAGGSVLSATIDGDSSLNIGVAVGGKGSMGGDAGSVTVRNSGNITTNALGAKGLVATSSGGGGGVGNSALVAAGSGKSSINGTIAVGGSGGSGGAAKAVSVYQMGGSIVTKGDKATAIQAMSTGGGGGIGGMAITQSNSVGANFGDINLTISVGGSGGKGETGGTVNVENDSTLSTAGDSAYGIFAQSVGGGGGDAGVASATSGTFASREGGAIAFALGGKGGASGDGNAVTVANRNFITTMGDGAIGIYAESLGGGGGNGGNARGTAEALAYGSGGTAERSFSLSASIGGTGGASGDGGTIQVTNTAGIYIGGQGAEGIYADSTGGGGGTGGSLSAPGGELVKVAKFINSVKSGGDAFPFSVNIGGDGGASGNGGAVKIDNSGNIQTKGTDGTAIEVHSTGGGGGSGGNGLIGRINVGGKGGAAGNGGNIEVTNTGILSTVGDKGKDKDSEADGIFAQSVGGGGGAGGATDTVGSTSGFDISSFKEYAKSVADLVRTRKLQIGISIGGSGGASGNGGAVSITNGAAISTDGSYANGIFAQSVGGGGGTGGVGVLLAPTQITIPGAGSNAGNGGNVTVNNSGAISTFSNASMGIFAQSVGGGGGVAGAYAVGLVGVLDLPGMNFVDGGLKKYARAPGTLAPSGSSGNGGNVKITTTGDITVTGIGSIGILAQTAGGGGGLIGGAGAEFLGTFGNKGNGGNIDLMQSGTVNASGANGIGILLQSVGYVPAARQLRAGASADDGRITASIGGTVIGGDGLTGTGMAVSGGSINKITILPTGSLSAKSGVAFLSGSGNETLTNQGTITGSIDMGEGNNSFVNQGQFYAGPKIDIGTTVVGTGTTGRFTNAEGGLFQVGNGTSVQDATIDGAEFHQTGGTFSVLLHDASVPGTQALTGSKLAVFGYAQLKGGSVKFGLDSSGTLPVPGKYSVPILAASGGVTLTSNVTAVSSNPLISATLSAANFNVMSATVKIDYTPAGVSLSPTQSTVGDAIAAIAKYETAAIHPLLGATRLQQGLADSNFTPLAIDDALDPVELAGSAAQLADVYQSLSPAPYAAAETAQLYAAVGFNDTLLADGAAASYRVANDDDRVAWLDLTGWRYSADFAPTNFSENDFGASAGFSTELGGSKVGAGVGYQQLVDHMSDYSSGSGWRMMAGLTAEHDLGPVEGEVALSAGAENLRTNRRVYGLEGSLYTTAKQTSAFGTATFRVSHAFGFGDWQVRPMIDASVAVLGMPGVTETGAGPLDLDVRGNTSASFRIGPAVDIKGKTTLFGMAVEPRFKVGFSDWVAGGNPTVRADFVGLAGIPDLVSAQPDSGITADVMAGIGMDTGEGIDMRLFYTGHLNGETQIHAINVQAAYHF